MVGGRVSRYTGNGLVQSEKGSDFQFNKPQLVIPGVTVDPSKKFSWRIGEVWTAMFLQNSVIILIGNYHEKIYNFCCNRFINCPFG